MSNRTSDQMLASFIADATDILVELGIERPEVETEEELFQFISTLPISDQSDFRAAYSQL